MQALLLPETHDRPEPVRAGTRRRRPQPLRDPAYAALSLPEVSALRQVLVEHEGRTAYWVRALRARLAAVGGAPAASGADLSGPLREAGRALDELSRVDVHAWSACAALPDLAALWTRRIDPGDETGCRRLRRDLDHALARLDDHAALLRARREGAAAELVARYREQPALALLALPTGTTTGGRRPC
ncbi:MAG: hypothetical protein U0S36_11460 [Candidatus Nanopelagicales bacterium]